MSQFDANIPMIRPGDPIMADWLNRVRQSAMRGAVSGDAIVNQLGTFIRPAVQSSSAVPFLNGSGETCPAYGVIRIAGIVEAGNALILDGQKPNNFGSQYLHYINGPKDVPDGKIGRCYPDDVVTALYEISEETTPPFGSIWGPRNDSWSLHRRTGGWTIVGDPDETLEVVAVRRTPFDWFMGAANEAIALSGQGDVSIYYWSGTGFLTTSVTMPDVFSFLGGLPSGSIVECKWLGDLAGAQWHVSQSKECTE